MTTAVAKSNYDIALAGPVGSLDGYIQAVGGISVLTKEDEQSLARRLRESEDLDAARDLVMAHKWFNLAAMRGNECARTYRIEIASELDHDEIAAAQRLARDWLMTVH